MSKVIATILALVACIIVCLPWAVSHYRDNAIAYKEQHDKKVGEPEQATTTTTDVQQRQCDVDVLDAKYTEGLTDAKAGDDVLQHRSDSGGWVLVKGKCPVSAATQTAGAVSMSNDATVEFPIVTGRNVLGIRSGILSSRTAPRALQEYITTQCLK